MSQFSYRGPDCQVYSYAGWHPLFCFFFRLFSSISGGSIAIKEVKDVPRHAHTSLTVTVLIWYPGILYQAFTKVCYTLDTEWHRQGMAKILWECFSRLALVIKLYHKQLSSCGIDMIQMSYHVRNNQMKSLPSMAGDSSNNQRWCIATELFLYNPVIPTSSDTQLLNYLFDLFRCIYSNQYFFLEGEPKNHILYTT